MNERVAGLGPRRSENCPLCGKPVADRYRPFCSSRCADVDLNRWLSGAYVIPGQPEDDTEPPVPPAESD